VAHLERACGAAVINYRLSQASQPGVVAHPTHTLDGAAAVTWLYHNVQKYGLDPARIVIGGHSAGGHMTGLLALAPATYLDDLVVRIVCAWMRWPCQLLRSLRMDGQVGLGPEVHAALRGVVGIEGIYDLPQLVNDFPEYEDDFVALAFGTNQTAWSVAHVCARTGRERRDGRLMRACMTMVAGGMRRPSTNPRHARRHYRTWSCTAHKTRWSTSRRRALTRRILKPLLRT
jgi:hypothetical protein